MKKLKRLFYRLSTIKVFQVQKKYLKYAEKSIQSTSTICHYMPTEI